MTADRLLVFERGGAYSGDEGSPTGRGDAMLREACLRDVVARAARERGRIELWLDSRSPGDDGLAGVLPHVMMRSQRTGSFGARLADAVARSFDDDAERVVVLDAAAATVPDGRLTAAFEDLRQTDVVLGPCTGGGYYLVGLRASAWPRAATLFALDAGDDDGIADDAVRRAAEASIELLLLPGWYTVGSMDGLSRARQDAAPDSHLAEWLRERGTAP